MDDGDYKNTDFKRICRKNENEESLKIGRVFVVQTNTLPKLRFRMGLNQRPPD